MDWPSSLGISDFARTINTQSLCSAGGVFRTALGSRTWTTANKAVFIPFRISRPVVIAQLFIFNGAAVSGNVDVGIYDAAATKLISSGSTVQTGTSVLQLFDVTDTLIGPGLFYLAAALDNTTGTAMSTNNGGLTTKLMGCVEATTAFALPATATWITSTAMIPFIGATLGTVI